MTQDESWLLKEKYHGIESAEYASDRARLMAGEPLAYVIGSIPFLNTTIFLDSHPLIPRPETEFWTEKIIAKITHKHPYEGLTFVRAYEGLTFVRVLDLCAGSGCIGVSILKAIPHAQVDFVEIDVAHHATIQKNIRENGIKENRTRILGGSLFENITQKYDIILSNPPYIDPMIDRAEDSVKAYEPHRALYGGESGMEIISEIIHDSPNHLEPHGILVIEHEPEQTTDIHSDATMSGFVPTTQLDQYDMERYTILHRKP